MNIEKPNHLVNLDNISCTPYTFLQLEKYTFLKVNPNPWSSWGLWLLQEQARQKPLFLWFTTALCISSKNKHFAKAGEPWAQKSPYPSLSIGHALFHRTVNLLVEKPYLVPF